MKNEISRKQFLHLGMGATAALLLPGCPAGDDTDTGAGTDSTTDPTTTTNPSTTEPSTTEPSTTEPSTTDPSSSTDPATTDPSSSTDPATTDPSTSTDPSADSSGSGDTSGTTGDAFDCSVDPMVIIGANHMHSLTVTAGEIAKGAEVLYDIQGQSLHTHSVTLTEADFATLVAEGQVVVESSLDGHSHTITVTCLPG